MTNMDDVLDEECTSQHILMVGDFKVFIRPQPKQVLVFDIKVWKLRDQEKQVLIIIHSIWGSNSYLNDMNLS